MRGMSTASPLPNDIEALKRLIAERDALIVERDVQAKQQYDALLVRLQQKDAEASNLALLIDKLKLQIAMLKRARFGASSEKLDTQIEQLELIVEELEAGQVETAFIADEQAPAIKQVAVRKPLPEHLPRETVTHAAACACPSCGSQTLRLIGTDMAEMLEYVPERFKVIRHERPKYACQACDTLIQRSGPANLNSAISENSGHKAGPRTVWREGVFDGQEISPSHPSHSQSGLQGAGGTGGVARRSYDGRVVQGVRVAPEPDHRMEAANA